VLFVVFVEFNICGTLEVCCVSVVGDKTDLDSVGQYCVNLNYVGQYCVNLEIKEVLAPKIYGES
jgi:hypothetical protein